MKKITFFTILILILQIGHAQNTRINDKNTIGWWTNFTTLKLDDKWSVHLEYQWRRVGVVKNWQQSMMRFGVNYQVNAKLQLRVGYAHVETFAYGDIPIQSAGKTYTENRAYEMATITDKMGPVAISHRFVLEQRWTGGFSSPTVEKQDLSVFTNRFRYMLRLQLPLAKTGASKGLYVAVYDEIAINFGKNINKNTFDQNRLGLLLGYKLSPTFKIDGGYLSQILQLGRQIGGKNVFQYNSGIVLNTHLDFDLYKKKR